ncbi:class IV lanthionine synthetase LanL [Kribbella sp. CA-253562]|uniref:class IV lanthionine synthetase LanL n=1 Tax=Kribbella sp. CA-253562 TaxID=3239942 RepID=UPI003D8E5372
MEQVDAGAEAGPHIEPLFHSFVRDALDRHGVGNWMITADERWCLVRPQQPNLPAQGWKLHVSATPLSAPLVLARSVEVLLRHRCSFKFAPTIHRVAQIVASDMDRGSGGKFITVYPDESQLREIAEQLHRATAGLPGPGVLSDRRYCSGSLVHYRYGVFTGTRVLGLDGGYEAMLTTPEGRHEVDTRKAWYSVPSWAPADPFEATKQRLHGQTRTVKLNDRYSVRIAIRQTYKGGVYRAIDERSGTEVIIKQARVHAGSTISGESARDRLRNEAEMLRRLEPAKIAPRLIEMFEQQQDLFLVEESVDGSTLDSWTHDNAALSEDGSWGPAVDDVRRIARGLVDLVAAVHAEGLVMRDLSPSNVMIDASGSPILVDLEAFAQPSDVVSRVHTPGYGAPEQLAIAGLVRHPDPRADLYSLGATLFYLASGVTPVLTADDRPRQERLADRLNRIAVGNPAARWIAPTVIALLADDPSQRPGVDAVRSMLAADDVAPLVAPPPYDTGKFVDDSLAFIRQTMPLNRREQLWPTGSVNRSDDDPCNVQFGAAGVLGVLTAAYVGPRRTDLRDAMAALSSWTMWRSRREPRMLPGLYTGRSGTAWALLDAGIALDDAATVAYSLELAKRVPVVWANPDVHHGAAGSGLTQLHFWEQTDDQEFLARARQAADYIVAAAERDDDGLVSWPIPANIPSSLAGLMHYGFAHGIAGIGLFLLAAAKVCDDSRYLDLAMDAAGTLRAVAVLDDDSVSWPIGRESASGLTFWCSGAAGIGTFLLRMWQATGDEELRDLSEKAAIAIRRSRWTMGGSQCCGASGQGEFLLDLAEATRHGEYRTWAEDLAQVILTHNVIRDGRFLVQDHSDIDIAVNYGQGLAGSLAFIRRLRDGGHRLWLPRAAR